MLRKFVQWEPRWYMLTDGQQADTISAAESAFITQQ